MLVSTVHWNWFWKSKQYYVALFDSRIFPHQNVIFIGDFIHLTKSRVAPIMSELN